jgi:penicillin G amidase
MPPTIEQLTRDKAAVLPKMDGEERVPGLGGRVTIVRDRWGVPHIDATCQEDAFFGQGYVHAQDRLWQMELTRRFAEGTLAEILGEKLVGIDRMYRRLGCKRAGEAEYANLNATARAMADAYAAGANAAIERLTALPLEFQWLEFEPRPWTGVDTVVVWKVTCVSQSTPFGEKLLRGRLLDTAGLDSLLALIPSYPERAPLITPPGAPAGPGPDLLALLREVAPFAGAVEAGGGSNNWTVAPAKSATGSAILCGDPHLQTHVPGPWHLVHLRCPEFEVTGTSNPGVPSVVIYGHNGRVAWSVTTTGADVMDVFIERFDPADPLRYEHRGEWKTATPVREQIRVKGRAEPVIDELRLTEHGTVFTPPGETPALAVRWTAQDATRTFDSFVPMLQARDAFAFWEAHRDWADPNMNRVYADADGNIGYHLTGRLPVRPGGANLIPVPGWTGAHDWDGYVPFDEMPRIANPPEGFIATANNRVIGDDYPHYIAPTHTLNRAERLYDLLGQDRRFGPDDMAAIQGDQRSVVARELGAMIAALTPDDPLEREAVRRMAGFDGVLAATSVPAAIYAAFRSALIEVVVGRRLRELTGADAGAVNRLASHVVESYRRGETRVLGFACAGRGWDDIAREALTVAVQDLRGRLGADVNAWQWGSLHRTAFRHNLSRSPETAALFDPPDLPVGGDGTTLFNTNYVPPSYACTHSVSYRQIIDLGDVRHARAAMPPGNSGHPGSPHYTDLLEPWSRVEYFPLLWAWEDVHREAEATLRLEPGP